jgi:tRNA(Arg) A34 adenosine deaminase TadA
MLEYTLHKASTHSSGGRQRHWCVAATKDGKILAEAGNHYLEEHPLQIHYSKAVGLPLKRFAHAEVLLLAQMLKNRVDIPMKDVVVYVARAKRNGKAGMSKPCAICNYALTAAGIENIIYTTDE